MGEARRRGTFEQRREAAITAGRGEQPRRPRPLSQQAARRMLPMIGALRVINGAFDRAAKIDKAVTE